MGEGLSYTLNLVLYMLLCADRQASVRSVTFTDAFVRSSEGSMLSPPGSASSRTGIVAPPSKNMRAIIYENQIQKLAIQVRCFAVAIRCR